MSRIKKVFDHIIPPGYALFMNEISPLPENVFAHLNFVSGRKKGSKIILKHLRTTIGNENTDIVLVDDTISACHAIITFSNNQFFIKDNNSMIGSMINGRAVATAPLMDGDEIKIGSSLLVFHYTIVVGKTEFPMHGSEHVDTSVNAHTEQYDSIRKRIDEELGRISQNEASIKQKKSRGKPAHSPESKGIEFFLQVHYNHPESTKAFIFKITKGSTIIGSANSDIILNDPSISKQHALIEIFDMYHIFIRDLGSVSGTIVNKKKIMACQIAHHDEIQLGKLFCRLIIEKKTIA